jgi:hypothetical protein
MDFFWRAIESISLSYINENPFNSHSFLDHLRTASESSQKKKKPVSRYSPPLASHYDKTMSFLTQLAFWKAMITPNKYSHDKIPDLTGKVAIVTGANSGLGYATTVALAGHGAHVFMACRSQERALTAIEKANKEIKIKYPQLKTKPKLEFLELDLNDINKTKKAADVFLEKELPIHILVNNSGLGGGNEITLSVDGIEQIFAVSHLG